MTAEQIQAMKQAIEEAENGTDTQLPVQQQVQQPHQSEPEPLSFSYGGQTYEVRSKEELQSRIDEIRRQEEAQVNAERIRLQSEVARNAEETNRNAGEAPKFDKEEYANLFLKDPVAADEYLGQFSAARQNTAHNLASKVVELEQQVSVQQFLNSNQDYEPNAENFGKLNGLMQQYNLPWNFQGLSLAYTMGKSNGQFEAPKEQEEPAQARSVASEDFGQDLDVNDPDAVREFLATQRSKASRPAPPSLPRTRRSASANEQSQYLDRFENLPADKMRDIILGLQG